MPDLRLEDIAKKAGVSRSTVSRVVNNQLNVSNKVRQRVLKVIQETGYSPNAAARTLVSQRSNTIGLVLPHSVSTFFTDPYYPHLIKGISLACNYYDYTLALFVAGSREYQEKILLVYPALAFWMASLSNPVIKPINPSFWSRSKQIVLYWLQVDRCMKIKYVSLKSIMWQHLKKRFNI